MKSPEYIVVHCSDSRWGSAEVIREWHRARGWDDIGYHYVISNGFERSSRGTRDEAENGRIWHGRDEDTNGAHAKGFNSKSLGICMVGKDGNFTQEQKASLLCIVSSLMYKYGVPIEKVIGHYEADPNSGKTCPDIDMETFRKQLIKVYSVLSDEMCPIPPEV